jgi:hypothetical protein
MDAALVKKAVPAMDPGFVMTAIAGPRATTIGCRKVLRLQ